MYTILGGTHPGCVREHNEDRFAGRAVNDRCGYALVCDGMGGERGGSIASELACEEARRVLDNAYRDDLDEKSVYLLLETAIANASWAVYQRAQADDGALVGMGTTASLALLLDATCYIANVGDSRAYLLRGGELVQLTVDHTHVQVLVDRGEITPEEAREHPQRHYLTRAVGVEPSPTAYYRQEQLQPGDVVLLCSDGLHGALEETELASVTATAALCGSCDPLIDAANAHGGPDNITCMLILYSGGAANG